MAPITIISAKELVRRHSSARLFQGCGAICCAECVSRIFYGFVCVNEMMTKTLSVCEDKKRGSNIGKK